MHKQIDKLFNKYDVDCDQALNKEEIENMLNDFHDHHSKNRHSNREEVKDFINYAQRHSDANGCVTRSEFHLFYKEHIL